MSWLSHLRVLDLTRLLPGGFATLLFADLGADVIKVEQPGSGDYMRWMPPEMEGVSAGHLALNRGKRSITLNLKHEDGPRILADLVRDADVLIESFRPGVMDRLGVGYDALAAVNPGLVYCAITGYGQDGPYKDRAGHDINYLGYAGILDIIGEHGGPPVNAGVQIADVGGGSLMAAVGILAALSDRDRTGQGRFVDTSMLDGAFSWLSFHAAAYAMTGLAPQRGGMRLSGAYACYHLYRAGDDRWLTVGALEPQFWRVLCETLGVPEFIDRQFDDDAQPSIIARLEGIFAAEPRAHWLAALEELDACVGPVRDVADAFGDPQLRARGMIVRQDVGGSSVEVVGNPVRERGAVPIATRPAPGFGEHTEAVLAEAGFDADQIAAFRNAGAI